MKRRNNSVLFLTRAAIICALYVVLTYLSALLGLSSGVVQFRISELLCVLPLFFPEAISGITLGCFISNLITSGNPFDIIFGSLATLIGAVCARLIGKLPEKFRWLTPLPTVLANTLIVPPVIVFAFGSNSSYPFILLSVFVGEAVTAWLLGVLFYKTLKKLKLKEN